MTDPAGGAPNPQGPLPPQPAAPPPAAAPAPPPAGGNWNAPPPAAGAPGTFNTGFQQAAVEPGPAPGIAYADTLTRVIAYAIDAFIFFIAAVFIVGLIVLAIFTGGGVMGLLGTIVLAAISVVGSAVYFVYCWTKLRASVGQKVLNLEVVNAADGATLTQAQAIRRWAFMFGPSALGAALGYAPGALGLLGSLVGFLAFLYAIYLLYTVTQSAKRQGFHDVQAGTVVVKRVA